MKKIMTVAFESVLDSELYEAFVCCSDSPEDFLNDSVLVIL